jgi:oligopeptide/dipeptide ABC transporter ATP-binding protein
LAENTILSVRHLKTAFHTESGRVSAVDDVSFDVKAGHVLGVVGESGCGKSVTALSIMRLLPKPSGVIEQGEIRFKGNTDLLQLPVTQMQRFRGHRMAMIFQEPMTALNPVHRVGDQLREVFSLHFPQMEDSNVDGNILSLLQKVGIPEAKARLGEYPHQISGGMRQRIMIAMALAGKPDLLIADEPTTALDVTIQAQILRLILQLQKETGMAVMFITHDLGVIAEICDDVVVMYAGKVAEMADVKELFADPKHPYTQGLLASIPRLTSERKTRLPIIEGSVPSLLELPMGCRFQNRCPYVMTICRNQDPPQLKIGPDHKASCFLLSKDSSCAPKT